MSVAWHLAIAGCTDVLVLEAEPMLATGTTAQAVGGIRRQTGDPVLTALATDSLEFYKRFEERFGTPCDLRQDGYLFVATSEQEWADLRAQAARDAAAGVPVDVLTPSGCAEILPALRTDDLHGGTFCAEDGFLDPFSAATAFADAARRRGVRIRTGVRLPSPTRESLAALGIATDTIVLATGPALRNWTGLDITVAKRHVFALTPTAEALPYPSPLVLQSSPPFYAMAETASILISPAETAETRLDTVVEQSALELATQRATHRIPALANAGVRRGWAGLRSLTDDGRPAVGFLPRSSPPAPSSSRSSASAADPGNPRLFVTGAFNGKGVMLAPALGALAADLILGNPADSELIAALGPTRLLS